MKSIYLDYAAATPIDSDVLIAMQPYFKQNFYNPSALYLAAKQIRTDLEKARAAVARQLGARPQEIVFTAGGTESVNLAIQGVMQAYSGKKLVVSAIEHEAVLKPAEQYGADICSVDKDGRVNLAKLEKCISDDTVLVSVMYANNEIGTVQALREVATLINNVRHERQTAGNKLPLYLHTDGCQAGNYLDIHVDRLGVDLLTLNGGKIYGPKQSGILYIRTGVKLQPQILGGGQESSRRSGTENVAACIGFSKALETAQAMRKAESQRLAELRDSFIHALTTSIPNTEIHGSTRYRLPNNIHVSFENTDNERLLMQLDEAGIQCAVGSACSASSDEPSHVLKALGLSDETARSSLRFSLGRATNKSDIDTTVRILKQLFQTR